MFAGIKHTIYEIHMHFNDCYLLLSSPQKHMGSTRVREKKDGWTLAPGCTEKCMEGKACCIWCLVLPLECGTGSITVFFRCVLRSCAARSFNSFKTFFFCKQNIFFIKLGTTFPWAKIHNLQGTLARLGKYVGFSYVADSFSEEPGTGINSSKISTLCHPHEHLLQFWP